MDVFICADFTRDGSAEFVGIRVSPQVWEVPALLRLHGLNGAVIADQKHAGATGLFLQGKAVSVVGESREILDEIVLAQLLECGEPGDFFFC